MNGICWGRVEPEPMYNDTVIIIGGGRSLTGFEFASLKGVGHLIAVNGSGKTVPFAESWFTLDPWGLHGPQLPPPFSTSKLYAAVPSDFGTPDARTEAHRVHVQRHITFLHRLVNHNMPGQSVDSVYRQGLSEDTGCINTGNSGYGALNLAYHFRPKTIVLLGLDGDIGYYYDTKTANRRLTGLPAMFASAKEQLDARGIRVMNGSPKSTITAFPRMEIIDAIWEVKHA